MQSFNYHTHTYRCGHADLGMTDEDYVKEFIKKGFDRIAFTDHCPQKEKIDDRLYMRMEYSQLNEYLNSIKELKNKYKGIIEIQVGFEIEYLPNLEKELWELKQLSDKIILGQHFVYDKEGTGLKVCKFSMFNESDLTEYAGYIKEALEKGLPDIIAHPDIFMGSRDTFGKVEEEATRIICQAAEESGIPLEINLAEVSAHISNPNSKINYPCKDFWKIASEYNVKAVYGIDAHNRRQIEQYEESARLANQIIGEDIVKKLRFI